MTTSQVVGLSHVVLTGKALTVAGGSLLAQYYSEREEVLLDDYAVKQGLLREPVGKTSFSLYRSVTGSLPALELLAGPCRYQRPLMSYGLFFPEANADGAEALATQKYGILKDLKIEKVFWDNELRCPIAIWKKLVPMGCTGGLWMSAGPDFEFDRFVEIFGVKVILREKDFLGGWVPVVSRKLCRFFLLIYKTLRSSENKFFNDDGGLSTLGWFVRDVNEFKKEVGRCGGQLASDVFFVPLNGRVRPAVFYTDDPFLSHEMIALA